MSKKSTQPIDTNTVQNNYDLQKKKIAHNEGFTRLNVSVLRFFFLVVLIYFEAPILYFDLVCLFFQFFCVFLLSLAFID